MLLLEGHVGKVHALAFSADGLTLAAVSGRSTVIWLWELEKAKPSGTLRSHQGRVVSLAFAPTDAEALASADSTGHVKVWDVARPHAGPSANLEALSAVGKAPCQVCFAPGGDLLACNRPRAGASLHEVSLWQLGAGRGRQLATRHQGEVSCLAFSPDGRTLATGSFDRTVRLHDTTAPAPAAHARPLYLGRVSPPADGFVLLQGPKVHYLAFSPDGQSLASASPTGLIKLWDATTGHTRGTLKGQSPSLHAIAYSPDSRALASASGDGTVRIWDLATGRTRDAFDWGVGAVHAVAFAPDGMRAAAGGDGKIVIWDMDDWGA